MEIGLIYFYTATINGWKHLLRPDPVKNIITDSLYNLWHRHLINVYGFVVMPNHIHLIWQTLRLNGKERAQGSFLKFTAHSFKKHLRLIEPIALEAYAVEARNKEYEFWQQDPYAFHLTQRATALQKLQYIHNNPLQKHWRLCKYPEEYKYSSASFYATGVDEFGFMSHIMDVF